MQRKVTFTLSEQESADGCFVFTKLLYSGKNEWLTLAIIFSATLLLSIPLRPFEFSTEKLFLLALITLGFSVASLSAITFLTLKTTAKLFIQNSCDTGKEETVTWDETTVSLHSEWMKLDYPWAVLYKIVETEDFIIFTPGTVAGAISKRVLSADQLADLQAIIRRYPDKLLKKSKSFT